MTYSQANNLPPSGQDPGSGTTMQMVMAFVNQAAAAKAAEQQPGINPSGGVGYEPYGPTYTGPTGYNPGGGVGYEPYGPTYMGYNPSIYGQLGTKGNDY